MKYIIKIRRQSTAGSKPYFQCFEYEAEHDSDTAATALTALNSRPELKDTEGSICERIVWECSCLQKKCGACAMVINGRPGLACDYVLKEQKSKTIVLEPLKKFPVIADLMTDRSVMLENLKSLGLWLEKNKEATEKKNDILYRSSLCLQCGCCLEVCPNFSANERFFGMAALVPASRLLEELDPADMKELRRSYNKYIFSGCGKSLACRDICPAGIDIDGLMVNSNSAVLWKALFGKKEKKA